jgi:hypothetical protein
MDATSGTIMGRNLNKSFIIAGALLISAEILGIAEELV